jgi:hypothetical protein
MNIKIIYNLILILVALQVSCTKQDEILDTEKIKDYYPLQIGKYITYTLDSTVYINLGTKKEIRNYVVQDKVDSLITDNVGRPSYKIKRMIRSNTNNSQWLYLTSFLLTPDSMRIEMVQDNQRYLKMIEPIRNGFGWNGHSFINTTSFPELQYLDQWRYEYQDVKMPKQYNSLSFPETITIEQRSDTLGNPNNKAFFFEVNVAKEVYAKKVGLVFKEFLHEAWQPPNTNSPNGYYESNSYGIKLTVIDHNF